MSDVFNEAASIVKPKPKPPVARDTLRPFTPPDVFVQQVPPVPKHGAFDLQSMLLPPGGATEFFLRGLQGAAADIMTAAVKGDVAALKTLLSRDDVLPDFTNSRGVTPLMAAAANGHGDVVEMLASYPLVNLARQTEDGWTALHYAANFGQEKTITPLLKHHAPMDAKTKAGAMPHMLAVNYVVKEVFQQDKNFRRFIKTAAFTESEQAKDGSGNKAVEETKIPGQLYAPQKGPKIMSFEMDFDRTG